MIDVRTIDLDVKNFGNYFVHLQLDNKDTSIMLTLVNGYEEATVWLNKDQSEQLMKDLQDLTERLKRRN